VTLALIVSAIVLVVVVLMGVLGYLMSKSGESNGA
jgi:hypothetical protein